MLVLGRVPLLTVKIESIPFSVSFTFSLRQLITCNTQTSQKYHINVAEITMSTSFSRASPASLVRSFLAQIQSRCAVCIERRIVPV